ncbi:hypothetical protein Y1Q_0000317 [Alligator mississippiensis]|uniref:Uncharacterized protein n=1 Tax=Alligator mississippiensis TaxID=8496 RepID=A0A151LZB0_ALLMI|nr:hypothetical protein Y1Q_0000317 [Alligator mississippiensis]
MCYLYMKLAICIKKNYTAPFMKRYKFTAGKKIRKYRNNSIFVDKRNKPSFWSCYGGLNVLHLQQWEEGVGFSILPFKGLIQRHRGEGRSSVILDGKALLDQSGLFLEPFIYLN